LWPWCHSETLVVFEATGVYDLELREALRQAGIRFARINPARARDFARASGRLAKTDPIDARMLAAFARAMQPVTEQPADPARNTLAKLAKRRDQLVLMRAQEKTRRSEAEDHAMAGRISRLIKVLDSEIAEIEADISALIKAEPEISDDAQLMRSLPGVGPVACMQLIAQMPELGKVGPKQVAALAGLAPFNVDSGAFRGKRKIAGGRKRVRDALYMAALNAVRRANPFKTFYSRLRQAGKPAKLALIAVARKLLTVLNAMMRDRKSYLQTNPT
jgi:transposase